MRFLAIADQKGSLILGLAILATILKGCPGIDQ